MTKRRKATKRKTARVGLVQHLKRRLATKAKPRRVVRDAAPPQFQWGISVDGVGRHTLKYGGNPVAVFSIVNPRRMQEVKEALQAALPFGRA